MDEGEWLAEGLGWIGCGCDGFEKTALGSFDRQPELMRAHTSAGLSLPLVVEVRRDWAGDSGCPMSQATEVTRLHNVSDVAEDRATGG